MAIKFVDNPPKPAAKTAVKRGRPRIEDKDKTLSALKPWKAAGMGRSTWYRRQRSS